MSACRYRQIWAVYFYPIIQSVHLLLDKEMISTKVIRSIRLSTCAVHRMAVKHENAFPAGVQMGNKVVVPQMDVRATAFLVEDGLLLTNRHVVRLIAAEHQQHGNHDHWYVQFTYPQDGGGGWSQTIKRISNLFAFVDPADGGTLDVGFLSFAHKPGEIGPYKPVEFGDLESVVVGNDVGVCGFPLGNKLLANPELGIHRFGPLIHRGMISAVSPYDTVDQRSIVTFLTDLNTAGGMSGSPVFLPDNGRVVGLHFAGTDGTLGCAVPIDEPRVRSWIDFYKRCSRDPKAMGSVMVKPGGDLEEKKPDDSV